jgi:putative ABC transport system ATP-binding protein
MSSLRRAGAFATGEDWASTGGAKSSALQCSNHALRREEPNMLPTPIITVQHITKTVADSSGPLTILHEVDFELQPRESVAIVGASGSGKSTLLSIIAGLDTPTSGSVRLAGTDLFTLDEDARAELRSRTVGFVFQSFQLLANLNALENVMLPLELMGRADARSAATEMLKRVGLGERLSHYPKVLSGGEQQRVALARAFVVRPALLLADEPTGSLDFATGEKVMALMFELNREAGTTLVLVTHDRAIAARCDRQLRMEAGRIVERSGSAGVAPGGVPAAA